MSAFKVFANPAPQPAGRLCRRRFLVWQGGRGITGEMSAVPKKKIEPPPPRGRGRPRKEEPSEFSAKVYSAITPELRYQLELEVVERRRADALPARWGLSDLIREVLRLFKGQIAQLLDELAGSDLPCRAVLPRDKNLTKSREH